MTIGQIDWSKLQPYKHDKHKSFETLCFHIAGELYSRKGILTPIDDSGGGSGVEFYLQLKNRDVWGWQAKFYPGSSQRLTPQRRAKIIDSLKKSKEQFGTKLKRWFLCTPIDLVSTGSNSELRWFQTTLQRKAPKTRLVHWGASRLTQLLRSPNLNGILQFFFGDFQPTHVWFKDQVRQQITNLGSKYIPDLHTATSVDFVLHALLGDQEFSSEASARFSELSKVFSKFHQAVSDLRLEKDAQFGRALQGSAALLEKPTQALEIVTRELQDRLKQSATRAEIAVVLDSLKGTTDKLRDALSKHWGNALERIVDAWVKVQSSTVEQIQRNRLDRLRKMASEPGNLFESEMLRHVQWFLEYLPPLQKGAIHLTGGAGAGKTHVLAQTCSGSGTPAIFVRGISFSNVGTIQTQILGQINLQVSWEAFASAVNMYAKAFGQRVLIAIDALNEAADIGLWQRELAGFQHELNKYEGIALVTSCRESYKTAIWQSTSDATLLFRRVFGFDDSELKAALPKYFAYYKISVTLTLDSRKQFENPLYLRIFCESENRERTVFRQVFLGRQNLFNVFERYLDSANESFSRRIDYPVQARALQETLRKFASALWVKNVRSLPFEETLTLLGDQATSWNSSRTKALLDEELILSRSYFNGEERCEFSYDLLGGYLIADEILMSLPSGFRNAKADPARKTLRPILKRLTDPSSRSYHPLHEDILRSLAATFPARAGRHLAYITPRGTATAAGIDALFEMDPKYVRPYEKNTLTTLFSDPELRPWLLRRLSEIASSPNHPLNADFLASLLARLSMPDRDLSWSEYLRERAGAIKDLTDEFKAACTSPTPTTEHRKQLVLAAKYLSWVLTSNNPYLRDNATHALVLFGQRAPATLFRMTERSLTCNDPYVPERMLAAAYGAAMRIHCRPAKEHFRDHTLPRFAQTIFKLMFAEYAPFSTTHSLSRDYAKSLIDLALYWHNDALTASEKGRVAPPFHGGIRNWRARADYDAGKYREGNDPLGFDWKNYTMGGLARGRSTYDFEHPRFVQVKEQILWRIHDLGYSLKRFGEIDKEIARSHWYRRNESGGPDRYGKKYSWIAFHELHGYLQDKGLLPQRDWAEPSPHSDEADIDPSFPRRGHHCPILADDLLGRTIPNASRWVKAGAIPNFKHYLRRATVQNERGPWLALHLFFTRYDRPFQRNAYARANALLVNEDNLKKARQFLRAGKIRQLNLGKLPETRGLYAGELTWQRDFKHPRAQEHDVQVGTRKIPNTDNPLSIVLKFNGEELNLPVIPRSEWRTVPIYDALYLESPLQSSQFSERSPLERPSGNLLSRYLSDRFRLWLNLPLWDMHDASGKRVSVTTDRGTLGNHEGSVFVRQRNIELYLKENSLKLIWFVDGERQELTSSGSNAQYKQYDLIYIWHHGKIRKV